MSKHHTRTGVETAVYVFNILLGLCILIFVSFTIIKAVGKFHLRSEAATPAPVFEGETEEGIVHYNGKKYYYNKDIMTILCMGIDTSDKVPAEGGEMRKGGQSDAIFLLVLDDRNKEISVITIPRDTMTDIELYDVFGEYYDTVQEHLTLQYAYGDGRNRSCELTQKAVSNLMYQLPIHGYLSVNMGVIGELNDQIGGVTLDVCDEWLETINPLWKYGETVTLQGEDAETYVRARDVGTHYTAQKRLTRHKQYLMKFVEQTLKEVKKDWRLPFKMYDSLEDYMVTNVEFSERVYLAATAPGCYFDNYSFYSLQGENKQGAYFDEYYVDEEALRELIIKVFYCPEKE